jgi:hypothetical protein
LIYGYRITENKSANTDSKDPKEKEKSINVDGELWQLHKHLIIIVFSGLYWANEQVEIRSEVSGVKLFIFKRGSTVSKGQMLLK